MDRRSFLRTLPAVTVAGAAGCSSSSSDGSTTGDETDTETSTAEPTATPDESIEQAAAALDEAFDGIDRQSEGFGDLEGAEFEDGSIRASIADARDHLDAAEQADLTGDQQAAVDDLRGLADYAEALTDTMVPLGEAFASFSTVEQYVDTERFQAAIDGLDDAQESFRTAQTRLEDTRAAYESLDRSAFDRVDPTYEETRTDLEKMEAVVETMDPFVDGFREYVRGYRSFTAGSDALDAERYDDAANEFDTAAVRFGDAESAFMTAEETAPSSMRSDVIDLTCISGALSDASEHFAAAARALDRGDGQTANEEVEAAQQAIDRCETSDSAAALSLPSP